MILYWLIGIFFESLITEIEDKIDELEAIIYPDFMEEVYKRVDEIESGEIVGLNEEMILDLLKGWNMAWVSKAHPRFEKDLKKLSKADKEQLAELI